MFNAKLNKGGKADFQFPGHYNTVLLLIEGSIIVNGNDNAPTDHMVLMANEGEHFEIEATERGGPCLKRGTH